MTIAGITGLSALIGYIAGEIAVAQQAAGGPALPTSSSQRADGPSCGGGIEGGDE